MACLYSLPPELLGIIVSYLEDYPPSYFGFGIVPTLGLVSSRAKYPPLKSFSRVCKALRQVTLPSLFRCTIYLVTIEARNQELEEQGQSFSGWPRKFWEFATFLEETNLGSVVRSFALAIKEHPEVDLEDGRGYSSEEVAEYQSRWAHLLTDIAPLLSRVTIVAPPALLRVLCGIQNDLLYIMPAPYQILSLWIEPFLQRSRTASPGNASSEVLSLLTGRRWTHLLINESADHRFRRYAEDVGACNLISSSLLAVQSRENVFPEVRFVSYTALKFIPPHAETVFLLLGSLRKLVEVHINLRSTCAASPLDAQDQQIEEDFQLLYSQQEYLAEQLGLEDCLEHLRVVECPDRPWADVRDVLDPSRLGPI